MLQSSTRQLTVLLAIAGLILLVAEHMPAAVLAQAKAEADVETVVENLDTPWAIDFLPDGSMIFTERPGRVSVLRNGTLRTVGEIAVREEGESGLLGIAVDPQFASNRYVYLYYTREGGNRTSDRMSNRISRFTLSDSEEPGMRLENETVLLDGIPAAPIHDGGRLKFGPDGKLYATTGDAAVPQRAQDLGSLSGKVLRMDPNGAVPEDNPFGTLVFSYGHRNPQGLAWHPKTGELYASEHGPTQHDEISRIEPGADYGWPEVCGGQGVQPVLCYTDSTLAPGGVAFVGDDAYVAGLRGAQVRVISLVNGTAVSDEEFLTGYGRIRDVVEHDGYLYVATSNRDGRGAPGPDDDRILRVRITNAASNVTSDPDADESSGDGQMTPPNTTTVSPGAIPAAGPPGLRQFGVLLLAAGVIAVAVGVVVSARRRKGR